MTAFVGLLGGFGFEWTAAFDWDCSSVLPTTCVALSLVGVCFWFEGIWVEDPPGIGGSSLAEIY